MSSRSIKRSLDVRAPREWCAYNRVIPVHYHLDGNVVTIRADGPHTTDELREAWLASERDPAYPSPVSKLRVCVDARESASLAKRSMSDMRSTVAWIEFKGYRTFVTTEPAKAIAWLKEQPEVRPTR